MVSPISKLTFKVALPPSCCSCNFHSFFMTLFTVRGRHDRGCLVFVFLAFLFWPLLNYAVSLLIGVAAALAFYGRVSSSSTWTEPLWSLQSPLVPLFL